MPMTHFLVLGAVLFLIGAMGVLMRRNAIIILLSIELMLNAVNVTFVGFSRHLADMTGQVFAIFVITVAACEAAVGLAILIALNRDRTMVNVDEINLLKW
ncbi:MAG: NADH-quinone oxidoreductase subunit NuoK [Nitrospinae bacterium]|nr:NADH-quinone oxidoreductase subunit NuoK [Nitrospinota bacterium]MCY4383044.1 NADH-quinone oxidoreductase subunit NuoK [Nitrospinota bacterium]